MTVSIRQQNNQPSFKAVNIVQISKKAFSNPEDLSQVSKVFSRISRTTLKTQGKLSKVFKALLGIKNKARKTFSYFEQPDYISVAKTAKKNKTSIHWLGQYSGIDIALPSSPDHHSFYVLTGEHKDKALELLSAKNFMGILKASQKAQSDLVKQGKNVFLVTDVVHNNELVKKFNPIIGSEPANKVQINSLDDLPKTLLALV